MRALPIHECFYTWQGEGVHMGRAAFFIRTFGCPVQCPWCDAAGTWHPDFIPDKVDKIDPHTLAAIAEASGCEFVVITGGEPAIHDLSELTRELKARGLPAHIETSGAFLFERGVRLGDCQPQMGQDPQTGVLGGCQ
jgi:7-carboxy-7-deazaguanine synthase